MYFVYFSLSCLNMENNLIVLSEMVLLLGMIFVRLFTTYMFFCSMIGKRREL